MGEKCIIPYSQVVPFAKCTLRECWSAAFLKELAWCARNERLGELKKRSSPQLGCILAQNFGILPPNLGEDQTKGLLHKSELTSAGISDHLDFVN